MALFEILLALMATVALGTIAMLVWATWFKAPPPSSQIPPDPLAEAIERAEAAELELPEDVPAALAPPTTPLPQAVQWLNSSWMSFRTSDGHWISSEPGVAVMQDPQIQSLLDQGIVAAVSPDDLSAILSEITTSMQELVNIVIGSSGGAGGVGGTTLRGFPSSTDFSMRMTTVIQRAAAGVRDRNLQAQAVSSPPAPATPPPQTAPEKPADVSKLDRLLSDDDLV